MSCLTSYTGMRAVHVSASMVGFVPASMSPRENGCDVSFMSKKVWFDYILLQVAFVLFWRLFNFVQCNI